MSPRRLGATTLVALVGVALLVAVSSGNAASAPVPAQATARLQAGSAPWAPEYRFLATRLAALRLPGQSDTVFHIHARLRIFVDGRRVPVPAQIGIDPQGRFLAPLHTVDHVLRAHDRIVVGYGRPGSFPTVVHTPFPAGL